MLSTESSASSTEQFLLWVRSFQNLPQNVPKFAQFVTTNMTIFCNQLFLALTDVTDVALTDASVKVVLYERCTFCPVFFALSTTEEASHSSGERFGDQKHHRLVCGKTIGKSWPGQDHSKNYFQNLICVASLALFHEFPWWWPIAWNCSCTNCLAELPEFQSFNQNERTNWLCHTVCHDLVG